jgi:hypothetical protein
MSGPTKRSFEYQRAMGQPIVAVKFPAIRGIIKIKHNAGGRRLLQTIKCFLPTFPAQIGARTHTQSVSHKIMGSSEKKEVYLAERVRSSCTPTSCIQIVF